MRRYLNRTAIIIRTEKLLLLVLSLGLGSFLALATIANQLVGWTSDWSLWRPVDLVLASPSGQTLQTFTFQEYESIRESGAFEDVAALGRTTAILRVGQRAIPITCALVTTNYFDVHRARAGKGQLHFAEFHQLTRPLVINSRTARRFLPPDVIGQSIRINRVEFTIIGEVAAAEGVHSGVVPDVWVPLSAGTGVYPDSTLTPIDQELGPRGGAWLVLEGRLRRFVTITQANHQLSTVRFQRRGPNQVARVQPGSRALPATLRSRVGQALQVSAVGLGLFLLVGVVNSATFLLHRVARANRDRAVRLMLGASRARLSCDIILEAMSVSMVATVVGAFLSVALVTLITIQVPSFVGIRELSVMPSLAGLAVTVLVGQVCGLASCIVPVWYVLRADVQGLRTHADVRLTGSASRRTEPLLMCFQMISAVILLSWAAALTVRWHVLANSDMGFTSERVQVMEIYLDPAVRSAAERLQAYERILAQLELDSRIRSAALASVAPLTPPQDALAIDQRPEGTVYFDTIAVTRRYFETLGMRMLHGMSFARGDESRSAVILNSAALEVERRRNAGQNSVEVGTLLRGGRTVVGIVADSRRNQIEMADEPTRFVPFDVASAKQQVAVILAVHHSDIAASELVRIASAGDPEAIVLSVNSLAEHVRRVGWRARVAAMVSLYCGIASLLMALLGVFGVVARAVTRTKRDMAIRMALGAESRRLVWLLLRETVLLCGLGVALGVVVAFSQWRVLNAFDSSWPVEPGTAQILVSGGAALLTVVVACYVAARPLRRLLPAEVLRS